MKKLSLALKVGFVLILFDVVFWLLIGVVCLFSRALCFESVFAVWFFYLPLTYFISSGGIWVPEISSYAQELLFIGIIGSLQHFFFGYLLGFIINLFRSSK